MIPATITGSLPKPSWLAEPRVLWAPWRVEPGPALREAWDDALLLAIRDQERAGLDVLTDGEQTRQHFVHGFVEALGGVDYTRRVEIGIRNDRYRASVPVVTGPVHREHPIHLADARLMRSATERRIKITLPGPMTIVDTLADEWYGDRVALAMAFADALNAEARDLVAAGVDVIQFDEPAFNVYLDEVAAWGITALERAMDGVQCTRAVHICYGYGIPANTAWKESLGSEWRQYETVFPVLAASSVDEVSLECRNSRVPLELMALLGDKHVQVGCIDVATDQVESPEDVAATLQAAAQVVDPRRMLASTNCGMVPLDRDVARGKLRALAEGAALASARLGV